MHLINLLWKEPGESGAEPLVCPEKHEEVCALMCAVIGTNKSPAGSKQIFDSFFFDKLPRNTHNQSYNHIAYSYIHIFPPPPVSSS